MLEKPLVRVFQSVARQRRRKVVVLFRAALCLQFPIIYREQISISGMAQRALMSQADNLTHQQNSEALEAAYIPSR